MRHYIKSILITIVALYITYNIIPAVNFGTEPKSIFIVVGGLWLVSQIINPVFSLVLLPINMLTMGGVLFILNIAYFFALINFLPGFTISAYRFPGANTGGLIFPQMDFSATVTIILFALSITVIQKALHIVFE